MRPSKRQGFTFPELLICVIIIGVITAIALPLYAGAKKGANLKACRSNITAVFQAEEAYRVRNRAYTTSMTTLLADGIIREEPKCPTDNSAYTLTTSGSGSTLKVTVSCAAASGQHGSNPICINGSFDPAVQTGATPGTQ